ncbi:MAG: BREX-1 system adenine-specific DNA-methyltransferase PglX, partial [Ruminococcus sp.]|nr:BREX-1 system adenine-specific DNA-methyltransferase PglX [Ruminococcus sp.]
RQALIAEIKDKGYKQVMEEVAYTWFNRFSALRFMEVNGCLPSHVRVFTDEENNFKPQIITEAIHLDLDGLDMEKVYELKEAEKTEELYKYLLIVQCNALNKILPRMFQKISDYTELLLPDNLLREGSVIQQMIELIPEDDWKDAVQIIGWLYQYYNSEKKDNVFAALKKNVKITKENIPAATQLFTPDWIVRYMVENSLGRLWLEGHPDTKEQLLPTEEEQSAYVAGNRDPEDTKWHYYLEEAEQEPEVQVQLAEIRKEYAVLTPDQLKVIDPCSGSGHILAYMFDVLMKIYESYGYTTREAVASIVENNIYGLDIDDRAAQLAYFALMMKARQYDRRFFSRGIQPHVYAIVESNHVDKFAVEYFCNGDAKLKAAMDTIISELHDAKEYGSILAVTPQDWSRLYNRFAEITEDINMSREIALRELLPLVQVAEALAQKYDVVVTNPPYMGGSGMSGKLSDFVKKNYPDSKSDLFAVFIEKCGQMAKVNGYQAMITQHAWMFLSSFEKLRGRLMKTDIVNMAHLGARAFEEIGGEVVQTTSFVMRKSHVDDYKGKYCRLIEPTTQQGKEDMFLSGENWYAADQSNFSKIPGSPVAYWVSTNLQKIFSSAKKLKLLGRVTLGMRTGDNERFLKLWHEVPLPEFCFNAFSALSAKNSGSKWFPYNKGGEYRKWYGNTENVVNWENDGFEIKENTRRVYPQLGDNLSWKITSEDKYFTKGIAWSRISSTNFGVRLCLSNLIFDTNAPMFFPNDEDWLLYIASFMCSKIAVQVLRTLNPTLTFQVVDVGNLPVIYDNRKKKSVEKIATDNFEISKIEWDSFETSWDFQHHPLLRKVSTVSEAFDQWQTECDDRFNQLKANEEELNRIFIDIYGLQDELTPEVEDKDVTVRKADLGRDIRSFISYAVGCMFGRYSLDVDGLAYAGGEWDKVNSSEGGIEGTLGCASKYASFPADKDNIIPICDDEYFEDDIVGLFIEFVKTVYGAETLDENLKFIADALGGKGQPKDVIRNYFLNDFYADHCKIYQKRPIYWLFDSGKKNGFKALIYMHRYQPDTIARIRTDYVHEQQARYR